MHEQNTERRWVYKAYTQKNVGSLPQFRHLSAESQEAIQVVSKVLPFRTNNYVVEELIDWDNIPNDPIFQLTFPQPEMLSTQDFERMRGLVRAEAPQEDIAKLARAIQYNLNPHPAGQLEHNVPQMDGKPVQGVQRKYRETALFFPRHGQTCHAYCTYCFRWAQFIGVDELRFASDQTEQVARYVKSQPDLSDLLITGGDPLVMRTKLLRRYVEPLLAPDLEHLQNIRFGTKSVAYWPQRFVTDADADELLRLFEEIIASGRHVAIMAHFSHPNEISTPIAQKALKRLRSVGCEIRVQAPIVRHINDSAQAWATLWRESVRLGAIPYYMFIERDTGPKNYFEVPIAKAYHIFREAYSQVSGLARTVRGPSMSATPGKVAIDGIAEINGEKVFALSFLQGRMADWVRRPFYAKYDPKATWLTDLKPAFGDASFFFQQKGAHKGSVDVRKLQKKQASVAVDEKSAG